MTGSNTTSGDQDTSQKSTQSCELEVPLSFNEERFIKNLAEAQERFRQEYADMPASASDLELETKWWKPLGDLSTVMNNGFVPKEINDKLQAASKEFAAAKYSREAFEKFAVEARTLLVGHDEALRVVEETILKTPEVWDKMHEYIVGKQPQEKEERNKD